MEAGDGLDRRTTNRAHPLGEDMPLAKCQGNCFGDDSNCEGALKCFQRDEPDSPAPLDAMEYLKTDGTIATLLLWNITSYAMKVKMAVAARQGQLFILATCNR